MASFITRYFKNLIKKKQHKQTFVTAIDSDRLSFSRKDVNRNPDLVKDIQEKLQGFDQEKQS